MDQGHVGERVSPLGWWTLSGEELMAMLRRAAGGESPDAIYAEAYANAEHHRPAGDGTPPPVS